MVFTIRAIVEVLGFPEDHVKQITEKIVENIKKEEGITLNKSEINETKKVKEKFFSCFTEVEIKVHDFANLLNFCYNYMPSSVELLDIDKVNIPIREFNLGINDILARLHQYNILVNNMQRKIQSIEKTQPKKD